MEENRQMKRQRDEIEEEKQVDEEIIKRQKSFKEIINLLEEEEDEPTEDLSSLISTLQDELSAGPGLGLELEPESTQPGPYETDPENPTGSGSGSSSSSGLSGGEEEEGERVMKHLLEASDDELGIPNTEGVVGLGGFFDAVDGGHVDGGDLFASSPFGDGLWEFEDHEAANYYSLLQSEIFL